MDVIAASEAHRESFREAQKDSGPIPDKQGQTKVIVDAITEEGIPFGSILVARHWQEGKRAVFPYLLTTNGVLPVALCNLGTGSALCG